MSCLCLTDHTSLGQEEKMKKTIGTDLQAPAVLAGDVIGDYSFDKPLKRGDSLVFTDMAPLGVL